MSSEPVNIFRFFYLKPTRKFSKSWIGQRSIIPVCRRRNPRLRILTLKSDHLLTTPQGLTLIDFDTCTLTDPALDIGKFLADLEWWFTLQGISGVEEAQAELLKGYLGEGKPDHIVHERLARAETLPCLDPGEDRCTTRSALQERVGSQ